MGFLFDQIKGKNLYRFGFIHLLALKQSQLGTQTDFITGSASAVLTANDYFLLIINERISFTSLAKKLEWTHCVENKAFFNFSRF